MIVLPMPSEKVESKSNDQGLQVTLEDLITTTQLIIRQVREGQEDYPQDELLLWQRLLNKQIQHNHPERLTYLKEVKAEYDKLIINFCKES